jgi:hypothetical protein
MTKLINRKKIIEMLLPLNHSKCIWCINRVQELPKEIVNIAIRLSELNFIKYVKITDMAVSASSEVGGARNKVPVIKENHPTATGITICFHPKYKVVEFDLINSPIRGNGSKMVDAVLADLPKAWQPAVYMDWSDGFWDKMKKKYDNLKWKE